MSLYYNPVAYGINDVIIPEGNGSFGARIYYPSEEMEVLNVPIRSDTYPLIAFAHGDRAARNFTCVRPIGPRTIKNGGRSFIFSRAAVLSSSPQRCTT